MLRRGINLVALFYLATALICFVPYFQFDHPLLIATGLIYAVPSFVIAGGVVLRRAWGRKLAMILSPLLVLAVLPLMVKKQPTFVFSFPFRIAVTYPPSSAVAFKWFFGLLLMGHLVSMFYLLRGRVREEFQQKSAGEEDPKEGDQVLDPNVGEEGNGD